VPISTDAFREFHPAWKDILEADDVMAAVLTQPDARRWVDMAAEHLIERSLNILLDATLSEPAYAHRIVEKFACAGYNIKVMFVATSRSVSLWSNVDRYRILAGPERRPARTCLREGYRDVCDGVIRTAEQIDAMDIPVDAVRVYSRRSSEMLFGNDRTPPFSWDRSPVPDDSAANALKSEQERRWGRDETQSFINDYEALQAQMLPWGTRWLPWFDDISEFAQPLLAAGFDLPAGDVV
jgi:hypothetical protein